MGLIDKVNVEVNGSGDLLSTISTYTTKILKPNIVDGKNILTQAMISSKNTKYVIKYDYELKEDITIPEGCIFEFDGGSISGAYTITGTNTGIKAGLVNIFDKFINIEGIWNVKDIFSCWFKDCQSNNVLQNVFKLSSDNIFNNIYIDEGEYTVSNLEDRGIALIVKSNTKVEINGIITLLGNSFPQNYIIGPQLNTTAYNVEICGGGKLVGDRDTHINTSGRTDEWGHGIAGRFVNSSIHNITVEKCNGDCICIEGENVQIYNCLLSGSRRQGISLTNTKKVIIKNNIISDIFSVNGTNPGAGVDIEPNNIGEENGCEYIYIRNNRFINCNFGVLIYNNSFWLRSIFIENNVIEDSHNSGIALDCSNTNSTFIEDILIKGNALRNNIVRSIVIYCAKRISIIDNTVESEKTEGSEFRFDTVDSILMNSNKFLIKCNIDIRRTVGIVENNIIKNTNTVENHSAIGIRIQINNEISRSGWNIPLTISSECLAFNGNHFYHTSFKIQNNLDFISTIRIMNNYFDYINLLTNAIYHAQCEICGNTFSVDTTTYINNQLILIGTDGEYISINNNIFKIYSEGENDTYINKIVYSEYPHIKLIGNDWGFNGIRTFVSVRMPYIFDNTGYINNTSELDYMLRRNIKKVYVNDVARNYTLNSGKWCDESGSVYNAATSGTTANRPTNVSRGFMYIDTQINKTIWYNGNGVWADATGQTV